MAPWHESERLWREVIATAENNCIGRLKKAVAEKAIAERLTKVDVIIKSQIAPSTIANIFKYGLDNPKLDTVEQLANWAGLELTLTKKTQ